MSTITNWIEKGRKRGVKFDGCTAAPDLNVRTCCDEHDYHYQVKDISKWRADFKLFKCMWKKQQYILCFVYYAAVTVVGHIFWRKKRNAQVSPDSSLSGGP